MTPFVEYTGPENIECSIAFDTVKHDDSERIHDEPERLRAFFFCESKVREIRRPDIYGMRYFSKPDYVRPFFFIIPIGSMLFFPSSSIQAKNRERHCLFCFLSRPCRMCEQIPFPMDRQARPACKPLGILCSWRKYLLCPQHRQEPAAPAAFHPPRFPAFPYRPFHTTRFRLFVRQIRFTMPCS